MLQCKLETLYLIKSGVPAVWTDQRELFGKL